MAVPEPPPEPPPDRRTFRAWILWGAAAAGLVFALGACDVYNYDVGLHLAKGRWILQHHALPRPEVFITAKRPGFLYQDRWLFQVATWIVYAAGGWTALTLVKIAFILATFALLWSASRPAGPAACAFATLAAALLLYDRWDIRSELSIHVTLAAMLAVVVRGGRWAWAAPAVALAGANIHSVNIGVPGFLLVPAAEALWRGKRGEAKRWALVAAASFAALLVNPQGWNIFRVPVEYVWRAGHGPDWYRGFITEMQPATADIAFPSVTMRAIWAVVPLAGLAAALNWKRLRLLDAVLLLFGAVAAFSFRRNIGLGGVLLFPALARNSHEVALDLAGRLPAAAAKRLRLAASASLAALLAATALLWTTDLPALAERDVRREGLGVSHISLPVDACDFLEREGFEGDAFVNWEAGPYYNLRRFPGSLPSMNAEGDWNLETLKEFIDATDDPAKNFDAYAARYGLQLALLSPHAVGTQRAIVWLAASPDWAPVWRDEAAVVFARRDGPNAERVKRLGKWGVPAPVCGGGAPGGLWPWSAGARRAAAVHACRVGIVKGLFGDRDQRDCFESAIALWPGYAEAHGRLGAVLGAAGQPGADEEFREALRLAPKYVVAWMNLELWFRRRDDLDGAIRTLEQGLKETEDPALLVQLARDLLARRQDDASLRRSRDLLDRALRLRPGLRDALELRARIDASERR